MMVAPPLLWLGAPVFPLLLGLPRSIRTTGLRPLFRSRVLRQHSSGSRIPLPAWLLFAAATWIWHLPPTYELALASDAWHYVQHICFLVDGALILVSGHPAFSQPPSLVALAARSLSDPGRRAEHAPGCLADIFGSASVYRITSIGRDSEISLRSRIRPPPEC